MLVNASSIKKLFSRAVVKIFFWITKKQTRHVVNFLVALVFACAICAGVLIYQSPDDYQQGVTVKIMYLHLPCAILTTLMYGCMAMFSLLSLYMKDKISYFCAISLLRITTLFCAITIITGSIWGRPIWGVYWVWDPRLTAMLVLLLFLLAKGILLNSVANTLSVRPIFCVLSFIGALNIPIIKFAVNFWHSIHQKSSLFNSKGLTIDQEFLWPLAASFIFFIIYALTIFTLDLTSFFRSSSAKSRVI